jgi:hypothetical protein
MGSGDGQILAADVVDPCRPGINEVSRRFKFAQADLGGYFHS